MDFTEEELEALDEGIVSESDLLSGMSSSAIQFMP